MFEGLTEEAASEIRQRLDSVRAEGCRIGFAVESGSRAWGFPSPDSDFDCRFVYVRPVRQHLEFRPRRDVIEFPIVGDIDTGGWDLPGPCEPRRLLARCDNPTVLPPRGMLGPWRG